MTSGKAAAPLLGLRLRAPGFLAAMRTSLDDDRGSLSPRLYRRFLYSWGFMLCESTPHVLQPARKRVRTATMTAVLRALSWVRNLALAGALLALVPAAAPGQSFSVAAPIPVQETRQSA